MDFYKHYASNFPVLSWLVQEDEDELCETIKTINQESHIITVLDSNEDEVEEFKQALTWCQSKFDSK